MAEDLERNKKCAFKIILEDKYEYYQNSLNITEMETLADRREALCQSSALKNVKMKEEKKHFKRNTKTHQMKTRYTEYEVNFGDTAC